MSHRRKTSHRRSRRGVLLLVVLSMLVLFLMIGTAFLITAKQAGKAAKASAKGANKTSAEADQGTLLDEVVHQMLRGTTNEHSALRAHSLLEDMYGLDGFTSVIPPANFNVEVELNKLPPLPNQPNATSRLIAPYEQPLVGPLDQREFAVRWPDNGVDPSGNAPLVPDVTGGQILEIDLVAFQNLLGVSETAAARTLSDNGYAGQVLTFVSGRAKGQSTRIVGSRHHGNWITLQVLPFPLADGSQLPGYFDVDGNVVGNGALQNVLGGGKVLVNGRPFNGAGFGYDPYQAGLRQRGRQTFNGDRFRYEPNLTPPYDTVRLQMRALIDPNLAQQPPLALLPNSAFFNPNRVQFGPDPVTGTAGTNQPGLGQSYFGGHAIPQGAADAVLLDNPAYTTQFLRTFAGVFGADESYDAPDFQNMALALLPSDGKVHGLIESVPFVNPFNPDLSPPSGTDPTTLGQPSADGTAFQYVPLPSYHRPELLNFWAQNTTLAPDGLALNPVLLRHVTLRPNWFDHPNFSGSNPDLASVQQAWSNILATKPALSSLRSNNNASDAALTLLKYSIYGPWDVDNDNDGVRDSIWVDFGAPTITDSKGRRVKPLAAVLNVDMDGRVNVNASGTLDMAGLTTPAAALSGTDAMMVALPNGANPTPLAISNMPRGTGWGPADVSLMPVVGGAAFRQLLIGDANRPGRYGFAAKPNNEARPGHIGYDTLSLLDHTETADTAAEFCSFAEPPDMSCRYGTGVNALGQPEFEASMELQRADVFGLKGDIPYELNLSNVSARGTSLQATDQPFGVAELEKVLRIFDVDASTLPDRLEQLARVGSNPSARLRLTTDSNDLPTPNVQMPPFMAKLLSNPLQRPGTFAEMLETRVRFSLRKPRNLDGDLNDPANATNPQFGLFPAAIGTPGSNPRQLAAANGPTNSTINPYDNATTPAERVRTIVAELLAPELAAGMCLDINRPFGNGTDDANGGSVNGVVDEPGEEVAGPNRGSMWRSDVLQGTAMAAQSISIAAPAQFATSFFTPLDATPLRDAKGQLVADYRQTIEMNNTHVLPANVKQANVPVPDAMVQRQLLARHLYVLAMTLTAKEDFGLVDPMPEAQAALAQRLAQWAVNAVDFRDADNIMTSFEYDANPFDGWDVDNNLATRKDAYGGDEKFGGSGADADKGGVVWGCERPELLITETLAWHDRRTTDEGEDQSFPIDTKEGNRHNNAPEDELPDSDYDQRDRPRGALFVELLNPWGPDPGANADTHARSTVPNQPHPDEGVDVTAVSEGVRQNGLPSPVWRLVIHKRTFDGESHEAAEMMEWDPDAQDEDLRPQSPADRSIYLAGFDPEFPDDGVGFFNYRGAPDQLNGNPSFRDRASAYEPEPAGTFAVRPSPNPRERRSRIMDIRPVGPGRYLVVGSGNDYDQDGVYETAICHRPGSDKDEFAKNGLGESTRRIELDLTADNTVQGPGKGRVRMCDGKGRPIMDPQLNFEIASPVEGDASQAQSMPNAMPARRSIADVAIVDHVLDRRDKYDDRYDNKYPYTNAATGGSYAIKRRRLTLSEPARGYITNFKGHKWSEKEQAYVKVEDPTSSTPLDIPLDGPVGITKFAELVARINTTEGRQLDQADERELRTLFPEDGIDPALVKLDQYQENQSDPRVSYAIIYLQRLANPLLPWNPEPGQPGYEENLVVNPYRTADSMCANLTVFNSRVEDEENETKIAANGATFASCERGQQATQKEAPAHLASQAGGAGESVSAPLWQQQPATPERMGRDNRGKGLLGLATNRYYKNLQLNDQVGTGYHFRAMPYCSLGFLNRPFQETVNATAQGNYDRRTVPKRPFQWLTWNNRPYISGNELMLAPRARSSQLLRQAASREPDPGANEADAAYKTTIDGDGSVVGGDRAQPFPYLENFFFTQQSGSSAQKGAPEELYRILDYVATPSLFAGTQSWLNPAAYTPANNDLGGRLDPRFNRLPPFNKVSTYCEPGAINANTIADTDVYRALFHDNDSNNLPHGPQRAGYTSLNDLPIHPGPRWDKRDNSAGTTTMSFIDTRRGDSSGSEPILRLDGNSPTCFANPFRSATSGNLVPLDRMRRADIDATFLRSGANLPGTVKPEGPPIFAAATNQPYNDASRDAFFHLQPLIRLDNLATTRSNVYAAWVTVGFFEVENAPTLNEFAQRNGIDAWPQDEQIALYNRVYPDGYAISQEAGSDTGEVDRLRGFYLLDRTIPVGFQLGVDHNVDDAIRLKRRIE